MEKKLVPEVKRILFATDLSRNSAYAFSYTVAYARKFGAKIVIVHAFEDLPQAIRHYGTADEERAYYRLMKETATEGLESSIRRFCEKTDAYLGGACSELVSKILMPVGYPVEKILQLADAEDCDLIILGTHGKGLLRQTFVGSISRSIIERSHKPVLVIPLPKEELDWFNE